MEFQMFDIVQQTLPADTFNYMVAGYAVIFGSMLLYVLSLIIRRRSLEQDMSILSELRQDNKIVIEANSQEIFSEEESEPGQPVLK
jgi:hypothetical protein